jgi:16S rRNA (guanine966-N2)-methyltransferase
MRIYGNRQLKTLTGQLTRPTSARVREAVFNIWQGRIADRCWLDLCAGNGSMSAEALCRDAAVVTAIEQNPRACNIIKHNLQQVAKSSQQFQIIKGDVSDRLKNLVGKKFDFIYFDPPYASHIYNPVLEAIVERELLALGGEIAVEHNPKLWQAKAISGLEICREKVYGSIALTFYRSE